MKKYLLWLALLLPLFAQAQNTNGTLQRQIASPNIVRGLFGSIADTIPSVTGVLTNGYLLKYNSTSKKWYASPDVGASLGTSPISLGGTTNGLSYLSGNYRLHKVTATTGGVLTTGTDTIAGGKIFTSSLTVSKSADANLNLNSSDNSGVSVNYQWAGAIKFRSSLSNTASTGYSIGDYILYNETMSLPAFAVSSTDNSLYLSGALGRTAARVSKGWFTDLQVTNAIVGSITGNAGTVTTNANLTGPITSSGNATSVASQTGTGSTFVMNTSPTLVTPALGVASATSLTTGTITGTSTTNSLGSSTGSSTLTLGTASPSGDGSGSVQFINTNTFRNWKIGHNFLASDRFDFVPSTANGGSTFTTPVLSLTPTSATTITQSPNDNSTKVATTAYVDAQAGTSGTYTPTLTNGANVSSSTAYVWQYQRMGSIVTLHGSIAVTPTATATTTIDVSIPIASNFSDSRNITGTFFTSGETALAPITFGANTANDRITLSFTGSAGVTKEIYFSLSYIIIP